MPHAYIKYNNSKPAIRKTGDDRYELIWNVADGVLCVSVLTEEQMLELRDAIDGMTTLPPGAHKQEEVIYFFPAMNVRTTG